MLSSTIFSGLAFAGLSVAQSVVSLYVPGADTQPLVASLIGSDTIATTWFVQCKAGTDASDCGIADGITLTNGPSTAAYTMSQGYENSSSSVLAFTGYFDCSLAGTASAVCTESFGGDEANNPGMTTETLTGTDFTYMPATITTGAGSSDGSAAPSSTTTAPTASNTSGTKKTSSSTSNISSTAAKTGSTSSQTASSSSKSSTSTSTDGAPGVTGRTGLVLGGVALAVVAML